MPIVSISLTEEILKEIDNLQKSMGFSGRSDAIRAGIRSFVAEEKQNENWIPLVAMKYLAKMLDIPYIQVYEVATFYSMYNLSPVGKYFVQVCTTTPCMISGGGKLVEVCKNKISQNQNELSANKICSWMEVECLGACVNAPMLQINEDYFEDLDEEKTKEIINMILNDESPKSGSYKNRKNSEPESGRTTLINIKNA